MNRLNLRGVHVYEKIPGQATFRLKETHAALRLASGDEQGGVLFIQDGLVYEESGKQMPWEQIPGWFRAQVETANPVVLAEAGWKGFPKGK